eukprot:2161309-Rhodomonas_salina.3
MEHIWLLCRRLCPAAKRRISVGERLRLLLFPAAELTGSGSCALVSNSHRSTSNSTTQQLSQKHHGEKERRRGREKATLWLTHINSITQFASQRSRRTIREAAKASSLARRCLAPELVYAGLSQWRERLKKLSLRYAPPHGSRRADPVEVSAARPLDLNVGARDQGFSSMGATPQGNAEAVGQNDEAGMRVEPEQEAD